MAEAKSVAKKTKLGKVKMFGTGNFHLEDTLYVFRDGEEVEVKEESHKPKLEAEAERRRLVELRVNAINEAQKA